MKKSMKAPPVLPAPVVIASSDDGRILDVNDSFTKATGYSAEEVIARKATDLPLWKEPEKRNSFLERVRRGNDVINEPVRLVKKDGREINVRFSMLKISQRGSTVILSIVYTDEERKSNAAGETTGRSRAARPDPESQWLKEPQGSKTTFQRMAHSKIPLPTHEGIVFIRISEILYFKASGNYTEIFMTNGTKHLVSKVLQSYERMLTRFNFFRIHHSTLVQIDHIEKYIKGDGGYVVLSDNTALGLSRRKREAFLQFIGCKVQKENRAKHTH